MINPIVLQQAPRYRDQFDRSRPFRHLVMDYFFDAEPAGRLLADFPPFHPDNARNEFGGIGRKAVVTRIATISPFYAEVYRYISSREFLDFVSSVTGIPELIHDEQMFGGGTHENLEGQELDPHVDFNFIEDRKLHRRLNLLLYLNAEWEQDWGGCLELHSNPRRPHEDQITVIDPLFNRCVVFETSEHSWHGFKKIRLPEGKKHFSRKLLSIYLYTRERPAEEIAPPHATFYVQRPIPARLTSGHILDADDARQVEELITRRDHWIEHYQKKELTDSARIQQYLTHIHQSQRTIDALNARVTELEAYLKYFRWAKMFLPKKTANRPAEKFEPAPTPPATASPKAISSPQDESIAAERQVPLAGYVRQEGSAQGFWWDSWIANPFVCVLRILQPISGIEIFGFLPESHGSVVLCVAANAQKPAVRPVPFGLFSLKMDCTLGLGEELTLRITSDRTYSPARAGVSDDARELVIHLREIRMLHPAPQG